jgi:hypothetical protein
MIGTRWRERFRDERRGEEEEEMRTVRMWGVLMGALLVVAIASAAIAQSTDTQGGATSSLQAQLDKNASSAQANGEANAQAKTEAQTRIAAILAKGAKTSAKARSETEAKVQTVENEVDAKASGEGDQKMAERLAAEFGMTTDAIVSEKQSLNVGWGELMIAHTLSANSKSGLTVEQIDQMKKDGSGWGQIATGMGFRLGALVSAARAESRVAAGLSKPDGKVESMTNAHAASGAGVHAAGVHTAADVGADAGVKVKVGHP